MEFYYANSKNFNVKNVDLVEEAICYQEKKEKFEELKKQTDENHNKAVREIIESLRRNKEAELTEEDYMSATAKEVRAIMEKYHFQVN